jgi:hypothetical protein
MAINQIYPVITAGDARDTIELALESLREFPEVIVYGSGCPRRIREICAAYPNAQFADGDFLGAGRTKNQAASLAEGDWILALDADEFVSDGLLATLRSLELCSPTTAYSVHRHNLFMGRDMHWGGWGNEWVVRLYNRRKYHFGDAAVHERVVLATGTKIVPLEGALWHHAVIDIDQLLPRISRDTDLARHVAGKVPSPPGILMRTLWAFCRCYVVKLGFLEGWRGLVIATSNAVETFFLHMKRYANRAMPVRSAANLGSRPRA